MMLQRLVEDISNLRFTPYIQTHGSLMNGLRGYRYNIILGQVIWEAAAILEVLLRNRVVESWNEWFYAKGISKSKSEWPIKMTPLHEQLKSKYPKLKLNKKALESLENKSKLAFRQAGIELPKQRIIVNGDIVARLTFGFWHECLSSHFRFINSSQIKDIFPFYEYQHTNIESDISDISLDLQSIKNFRNRLAHHEKLDVARAKQKYVQICEYIMYINPDGLKLISLEGFNFVSNFPVEKVTRNFPYK